MKIKKLLNQKILGLVNCMALMMVAQSMTITCAWIFHQPKMPEAAKSFAKAK